MELDEDEVEVVMSLASRESEVVMNARARLASRVRKISDEGRRLVAASIARIARKLGQNARGIKARGIKPTHLQPPKSNHGFSTIIILVNKKMNIAVEAFRHRSERQ